MFYGEEEGDDDLGDLVVRVPDVAGGEDHGGDAVVEVARGRGRCVVVLDDADG